MEELGAEVVGGEIEGVRLDFGLGEGEIFVDVGLYGVEPVPIVPNMEILLVLQKQHLNELHLRLHYAGADGEEGLNEPLAIAPDSVGFGI